MAQGRPLKTPHDAPLLVDPTDWVERALIYAARYCSTDIHDDRIYDGAMDGLIRACQTYKKGDESLSFRNWLILKVNAAMFEEIRRDGIYKSRMDSIGRWHALNRRNGEDSRGIEKADALVECAKIRSNLTPMEGVVLDGRVRGMHLRDIARGIGKSKSYVSLLEQKIVRDAQDSAGVPNDGRSLRGLREKKRPLRKA